MSDSFAEVQEAMRQERINKFWHDYKSLIIGSIAALIIGTALFSSYNAWNTSVQIKQTDRVLSMIESTEFPDNVNIEDINLRPDLKSILLMRVAQRHVDDNKTEQAIVAYTEIVKSKSDTYQDLARIMLSRLSENGADIEQLRAIKKNSLWYPHALLEIAVIEAEQNNNVESALKLLNEIIDTETATNTIRQKAAALEHLYANQSPEQS